MGRDVSNYIIIKSDNLDYHKFAKDFIDYILEKGELMIYGHSEFDDVYYSSLSDAFNMSINSYRGYYKYGLVNGSLLLFIDSRKCDMKDSIIEFSKSYPSIDLCNLYMIDAESDSDLSKVDVINGKGTYYDYFTPLPNYFYHEKHGYMKFMLEDSVLSPRLD